MYTQLDIIKKHLNIDDYYKDDDAYLIYLAKMAENVVEKHIDKDLAELANERGDIPAPLLQAILLFIGNMYTQRESITYTNISKVPFSYDYLLDLYKQY